MKKDNSVNSEKNGLHLLVLKMEECGEAGWGVIVNYFPN
jgi:hypothetical protein